MIEAAAIVLAGGKSTRMGTNKALIMVNEQRMLEAAVRNLSKEFPQVLISANDNTYEELGVTVFSDIYRDFGPLGGIHAGLKYSSYHTNFFTACDMPFIDTRLALYMVESAKGFDAVVPRIGDYYQPLFAVYTKNCLDAVEDRILADRKKIISFYEQVKIRFVEQDELIRFGNPDTMFFNVNTPGDLQTAQAIAGREKNGPEI